MLIGGFFQLPPVAERALFNTADNLSAVEMSGRNAYMASDRSVELQEVVRQQGAEQAGFRDALEGLRRIGSCCRHACSRSCRRMRSGPLMMHYVSAPLIAVSTSTTSRTWRASTSPATRWLPILARRLTGWKPPMPSGTRHRWTYPTSMWKTSRNT